ncbi:MAG: sensor histidine kinase [Lachnospiraceae bacterium]
MKEETLKKSGRMRLISISILIPLMAVVITMSTYGFVKSYADSVYQNPLEAEGTVRQLFTENYVLYKNLYEKATGKSVQYSDIYLTNLEGVLGDNYEDYEEEDLQGLKSAFNTILKYYENGALEHLQFFDYYAEDLETGTVISNTAENMPDVTDKYFYYLEIVYDKNGSPSIQTAKSDNAEQLMKNAAECALVKNQILQDCLSESDYSHFSYDNDFNFLQYGDGPKNCRFIYGMTQASWEKYVSYGFEYYYGYSIESDAFYSYQSSGVMGWIALAFIAVGLLALFLPLNKLMIKDFHENKCFNLPVEAIAIIIVFAACFTSEFLSSIIRLLEGTAASDIMHFTGVSNRAATEISYLLHAFLLFLIFMSAWYIGLTLRPLREKGFKRYIKENCLLYRIFPFCKKQFLRGLDALEHVDVTKKAGKTIFKVVLINAVILFFISLLWVGGFAVTVVYSIVLYFLLKFYVSRVQKKYVILLSKIKEISDGNLNVEITEDLGIFNPFKDQLLNIQTGFRTAVEEEVKSQKMKSELITNVSHDLKTPLTAIITYVDLLKEENITEEQRKEYLDTLERKSLRLKVLIEDLFEVSKATSGNITLNRMDVDICNLVKQVELEMSDDLAAANLDVRMQLPMEKVLVSLDSQKTYRIYENLFRNIAKYSLPGTRVYVQGTVTTKEIIISLKNISATEITVDASQLTERFVRGDASRNTEGSGLGLAIVKSFVELQGGRFLLESDGDLFKAITVFPIKG